MVGRTHLRRDRFAPAESISQGTNTFTIQWEGQGDVNGTTTTVVQTRCGEDLSRLAVHYRGDLDDANAVIDELADRAFANLTGSDGDTVQRLCNGQLVELIQRQQLPWDRRLGATFLKPISFAVRPSALKRTCHDSGRSQPGSR